MLRNKINSAMIISLALASCNLSAKSLSSYNELLSALDSGQQVRTVFHLDKCQRVSGENFGPITAGFNIDMYNHYQLPPEHGNHQELIATSKTIFSMTDTFGKGMNYVRLHVFKDNSAELYLSLFDPSSYEQKFSITYQCQMNADRAQAGISFNYAK